MLQVPKPALMPWIAAHDQAPGHASEADDAEAMHG
jgi:hypothetical protein